MRLEDQIMAIIGRSVTKLTPLSGGMIGTVYRVDLNDGTQIVAKVASEASGTLDIEGYMLQYLAENSALPVPEVLHSSKALLLITYLQGNSSLTESVQEHAAELLAALHSVSAPQFGLERDTLIGGLHQPNPQSNSWVEFFRDHRLIHMVQMAVEEKQMPPHMLERMLNFCGNLENWIDEPKQPSLIHGDMWTTNILASNGKISGFVDPAIYYAHPEIELAFSTLFGTFGQAFFNRYSQLRPIQPDFWETRRDIYNLYPLLVHVRLFGGGYLRQVDQTIRHFGY